MAEFTRWAQDTHSRADGAPPSRAGSPQKLCPKSTHFWRVSRTRSCCHSPSPSGYGTAKFTARLALAAWHNSAHGDARAAKHASIRLILPNEVVIQNHASQAYESKHEDKKHPRSKGAAAAGKQRSLTQQQSQLTRARTARPSTWTRSWQAAAAHRVSCTAAHGGCRAQVPSAVLNFLLGRTEGRLRSSTSRLTCALAAPKRNVSDTVRALTLDVFDSFAKKRSQRQGSHRRISPLGDVPGGALT